MTVPDANALVIVEYNPRWPLLFEAEREWLLQAWRAASPEMRHVGSTSVPGLAAKPIIDILVLVERFPLTTKEIAAAVSRGYDYRGENGDPGREYFRKRSTLPGYHIHAYHRDHPRAHLMPRFRDYLIAHPDAAREYEALKHRLVAEFNESRREYTDGKTEFVLGIDRLAEAWASDSPVS